MTAPTEIVPWPVIGHEWAVDHLGRALRHGRMRHAYLLTGPRQIGKTTLARALAAALNCTGDNPPCGECRACRLTLKGAHPDLTIVQAEQDEGPIKIGQVRELQQTLALRPYEARYRVAILRRFDAARPTAQDALLKTLEEPSPHTVLILTADAPDRLLPTIISRCQPLNLRPLPVNTVREALEWQFDAPQDVARTLAQLSGGRIGWAINALQDTTEIDRRNEGLEALLAVLGDSRRARFKLAEQLGKQKDELYVLLDTWQVFWRDVLLAASGSRALLTNEDYRAVIDELAERVDVDGAQTALNATRRTLDYLGKNVNVRLALEVLLLDYPAP
jgi:DNA polymerase-3 subunit delta'